MKWFIFFCRKSYNHIYRHCRSYFISSVKYYTACVELSACSSALHAGFDSFSMGPVPYSLLNSIYIVSSLANEITNSNLLGKKEKAVLTTWFLIHSFCIVNVNVLFNCSLS